MDLSKNKDGHMGAGNGGTPCICLFPGFLEKKKSKLKIKNSTKY
jgi:hypothetical protein